MYFAILVRPKNQDVATLRRAAAPPRRLKLTALGEVVRHINCIYNSFTERSKRDG